MTSRHTDFHELRRRAQRELAREKAKWLRQALAADLHSRGLPGQAEAVASGSNHIPPALAGEYFVGQAGPGGMQFALYRTAPGGAHGVLISTFSAKTLVGYPGSSGLHGGDE